jgi:hypothetical protein
MAYVLKKMSQMDKDRVCIEADAHQRAALDAQGGYFAAHRDLEWAVDETTKSYLLPAPQLVLMTMNRYFFIHYGGKTYEIEVLDLYGPKVDFEDDVPASVLADLKREIVKAFAAHGLWGKAFVPQFSE